MGGPAFLRRGSRQSIRFAARPTGSGCQPGCQCRRTLASTQPGRDGTEQVGFAPGGLFDGCVTVDDQGELATGRIGGEILLRLRQAAAPDLLMEFGQFAGNGDGPVTQGGVKVRQAVEQAVGCFQ